MVIGTCADLAENSASDTQADVHIDKTVPQINLSIPSDGAIYLLNATVNAAYGCTDSLSGVASCNGTVANGAAIHSSTVGQKQFTVDGSDVAANTASRTNNYSVQYTFSGFGNPARPMPMMNVVKAGRTVPVKYSLLDANGAFISDLASFGSLLSAPVACDSSGSGPMEKANSAGSTTIRYDTASNQFIYNWKTDSSWAGSCRALQLTLNDGTQHLAMFQFK